jgi:hypothetical protein
VKGEKGGGEIKLMTEKRVLKMSVFTLRGANIVILAKQYNPSIATKDWLDRKGIIREADIINFVHTPPFSLVETSDFSLVVDFNRLQISVKKINLENINILPKIAETYTNSLPETPYKSIGFNFSYSIVGERSIKDILCLDEEKIVNIYPGDYRLGMSVHTNFRDYMMRLNIQPSNGELIADFNFHFELSSFEVIRTKLGEYQDLMTNAKENLGRLFNE